MTANSEALYEIMKEHIPSECVRQYDYDGEYFYYMFNPKVNHVAYLSFSENLKVHYFRRDDDGKKYAWFDDISIDDKENMQKIYDELKFMS